MPVRSLGREDPLQEEMATHSSILAWRIPWTEEPGGLQFMGSQGQTRPKRLGMHAGFQHADFKALHWMPVMENCSSPPTKNK